MSPSRGARFLPSSIAATRFSRCRNAATTTPATCTGDQRERSPTRAPTCTCSTVSSPQKRSVRVEPAGEGEADDDEAAGRRSSSRRAGCGRRGAARRPPARGARGERWRAGRGRRSEARPPRPDEAPGDAHDDDRQRRPADGAVPAAEPERRRPAERDGDDERPVQDANERVPDGEGGSAPRPRRRRARESPRGLTSARSRPRGSSDGRRSRPDCSWRPCRRPRSSRW